MKLLQLKYVAVLLLAVGAKITQAQVIIQDSTSIINLAPEAYYLEDATGQRTVAEILQQPDSNFKKINTSVVNFGITASAFWIKCPLTNRLAETLLVEMGVPTLKDIDLFELAGGRVVARHHTGDWQPFEERETNDVNYQFEIGSVNGASETLLIRVLSHKGTHFSLVAGTKAAFYDASIQRSLIQGMYYGVIIVMALYNLMLFFLLRDRSYLYYVLYILSMGLFNAEINGYTFKYLWPHYPVLNQYADISSCFVGLTAILFATHFLDTRKNAPRFHQFFSVLFACFFVMIFVIAFNDSTLNSTLLSIVSLVLIVCFFITAYSISQRNYKPAKFFLIAWSTLLVGVIVFVLKDFGVLPNTPFTAGSLQIGSTIEAVLLSMALANRINIYKKEKEKAQSEALESLRANQKLIEEQNVVLEGKVEIQEQAFMKISQEIHDNIGQKLTLAKLNLNTLHGDLKNTDAAKIQNAKELISTTIQNLRDLSRTLNTEVVVNIGLLKAIQMELALLEKSGTLQTSFTEQGLPVETDPKKELIIFRVVQEAIQNVVKHANATALRIAANYEGTKLQLLIEDNGIGFDPEQRITSGSGLQNMRSRARVIGAGLTIHSKENVGTTICIDLPLTDA